MELYYSVYFYYHYRGSFSITVGNIGNVLSAHRFYKYAHKNPVHDQH